MCILLYALQPLSRSKEYLAKSSLPFSPQLSALKDEKTTLAAKADESATTLSRLQAQTTELSSRAEDAEKSASAAADQVRGSKQIKAALTLLCELT